MSDKHHKKEKKHALMLKNRHLRDINMAGEAHARGRDLEKEREEELREAALASSRGAAERKSAAAAPGWRDQVQMLKDRNTGKLRAADNKWGRFAGTESGGGRGL